LIQIASLINVQH